MKNRNQTPIPYTARYSKKNFPPYTYLPGKAPHPQRDPNGHSYNKEETKIDFIPPENWKNNELYLYGVDLFNHGYWWEAHEAWETVWHTTNKEACYGQFLQGLIQIAAAFIKLKLHEKKGKTVLYTRGMKRLNWIKEQKPIFMGVNLTNQISLFEAYFTSHLDFILKGYPYIILEL